MNKKTLNEYQELVRNDEYSKEANDNMHKSLVLEPLVRFLILFILLMFSIINYDKVSKLAKITFDSLLNHEDILGPKVYFAVLIVTCSLLLLFAFIMYLIKERTTEFIDHLKGLVRTYVIYDFISFLLTSVIILYFVIMFVLTPCTIDGDSMKGSLNDKDRVMVWHFALDPKNDDIVIFDATNEKYGNYDGFFVKRIVACENETLTYNISTNELFVNDTLIDKIRASHYERIYRSVYGETATVAYTFVIPEDRYLVLGDNRDNSTDSRMIGLIYEEDILGKVTIRFYPFSRIGKIEKDIIHIN